MKGTFKPLLLIWVLPLWLLSCAPTLAPAPASVKTAFFTNPIAEGADPWVLKKEGTYYFCASYKNGIYVSTSDKLTQFGERKLVWQAPSEGWNAYNIWAPEIHFLQGKWYIYYTAGKNDGGPFLHQRSGVLESGTDSPFGPYHEKSLLLTADQVADSASNKWAIDLTPFYLNNQLYAIWSGWEQNAQTDRTKQHLYIAKMSNPWTINSDRVKISSPEEAWETGGELDLMEGPQILKKNEKAFVIYSTRESWLKEYRLGQLLLADTLADPMKAENWLKSAGPVFEGNDQVLGVGHCSFTTSPDGTEDWILYHSKKSVKPGWQRNIRMQKFTWTSDGFPVFGKPVATGVPLAMPSGQK